MFLITEIAPTVVFIFVAKKKDASSTQDYPGRASGIIIFNNITELEMKNVDENTYEPPITMMRNK